MPRFVFVLALVLPTAALADPLESLDRAQAVRAVLGQLVSVPSCYGQPEALADGAARVAALMRAQQLAVTTIATPGVTADSAAIEQALHARRAAALALAPGTGDDC